jgi:hypothetical protein
VFVEQVKRQHIDPFLEIHSLRILAVTFGTSWFRVFVVFLSSSWKIPREYLNTIRTEFQLNNISKFSLYLTGNTSLLCYKHQPVNAV